MLTAAGATVLEERSSGKAPLTDAEARGLLRQVDEVVVSRARRRDTMPAWQATVDDLKGPTGGYRAPMIRAGRTLFVGLQLDSLRGLLER